MWHATLPEGHPDAGSKVLFLPFEYTNRHPTRSVSLEFDVLWTRQRGDLKLGPFKMFGYRGPMPEDVVLGVLAVPPDTHVKREICLEGGAEWLFESGGNDDLKNVAMKEDVRVTLRVTDHVSGATVETRVPRDFKEPVEVDRS
jgi:hypothetical protein